MANFASLCKTHILGIFFAVFVGLCAGLPFVLAPIVLGEDYRGVQFLYMSDDNTYRARIHEILDGHYRGSSTNLYEYKDAIGAVPPINDMVYALPAMLFGLALVIAVSQFLFPALIFLFVYMLVYNLTKDIAHKSDDHRRAIWSAVIAGLLSSLSLLMINPPVLLSIVGGTNADVQPLIWTRLIHPVVGGMFLFGFLALLSYFIKHPRRRYVALIGIVLAPTVGYFFSFALAVCILWSLIGVLLVRKEFMIARRLIAAFIVALIIEIPYWYTAFTAIGGPDGRAVAEHNGMIFTHSPVVNKLLLVTTLFVAASFLYVYVMKRWKEESNLWIVVGVILSGSWLAYNHQIITGRQISYEHFPMYTAPLCFSVVVLTLFAVYRKCLPKIWKFVMGSLATFCVSLLVYSAGSFQFQMDDFLALQKNSEIFAFLDAEAEKECVVLIRENDTKLEQLIPAYTSCNVYITTYTYSGGITRERILHNYLLRLRLLGLTEETVHEYLISQQGPVRNYFHDNWDQLWVRDADPWYMRTIAILEGVYGEFLKSDLKEEMLRYRMDYLASSEPLAPEILRQLPGLTLVKRFSDYYFYSFK